MNNKLLATTMFIFVALGAYSAPIYKVLDLNSSFLIQNESFKSSLESDSDKLLLFNLKKKSKNSKKKEIEEDIEEFEEEDDIDSDEVDGSEDGDDIDNSDDDTEGNSSSDYTDDDDDDDSNSNGFGDIKSSLDKKNKNLPESKNEYHIHKNAPHNTVVNRLDPQGNLQEYITYLYGDEIIMKFTFSLLANGRYHIDGKVNSNYKTVTPPSMVGNTKDFGSYRLTEFDVYGGKIKATFKITPVRNGGVNIDYNWKIIDPNI